MDLLQIVKQMYRIREIELCIAREYPKGQMRCPTHLSIGQELPAVAICSGLTKSDLVFSTHRSHAHYLAKGGSLKRFIAELMGKSDGCSGGFGGSMHLVDRSVGFEGSTAIVANTIPVALGAAFAENHKQSGSIVCSFFGEGATEEGVFYETLNAAALFSVPLLFVCENNGYSVYASETARQPQARSLVDLAIAMGVMAYRIEGNDVSSSIERCHNVIKTVRNLRKPALVEMPTYRWLEHCGHQSDDHLNYRPKDEIDAAMATDPLNCAISQLNASGRLNQSTLDRWRACIETELQDAFAFAETSSFPPPYVPTLYD